MLRKLVFLLLILPLLVSCTAVSKSRVIARFPKTIKIEEFVFFHMDWPTCTFAEVRTSSDSYLEPSVIERTEVNLASLIELDKVDPFQPFVFPPGGFAIFKGRSVVDVARELDRAGDRRLALNIEEMGYLYGKKCWNKIDTFEKKEKEANSDKYYFSILNKKNSETVLINGNYVNIIIFEKSKNRAYYLGS